MAVLCSSHHAGRRAPRIELLTALSILLSSATITSSLQSPGTRDNLSSRVRTSGFLFRSPSWRTLHLCHASSSSSNNDSSFLADLRERQQELERSSQQLATRWRQVTRCKSGTVLVLPDWVRRVAVDYPLIATGSASGELFVGSAETNQILTSTARGRNSFSLSSLKEQEEATGTGVDELLLEQTCRVLYGSYDGGGTIAIAFDNKLLVDAPRSGGVRLHRVAKDKESVALIYQGGIPALQGVLVTCVELQPDYLLVGTADGRVQAYALDDDAPLFLQSKPRYEWNLATATSSSSLSPGPSGSFGSCCPITSLSPCTELQCVIATTAASSVQILSIPEDDEQDELVSSLHQELQPVASFYPPFDSSERKAANAFCLSAAVVKRVDANATASYSIVCGGNDGSVYVQPLNVQRPQGGTPSSASVVELALTSPLFPLRPFHNGPVVAMTSPAQGLVATASQDGTLRMYDVGSQTRHSRILYQFAGYKVWVGSLCVAHGDRLYTDGADNQVIGHHFRGKDDADAAEGETKTADDGKAK